MIAPAKEIVRAAQHFRSELDYLLLKESCGLPVDGALIGITRHMLHLEERRLEAYGMGMTRDGDPVWLETGMKVAA